MENIFGSNSLWILVISDPNVLRIFTVLICFDLNFSYKMYRVFLPLVVFLSDLDPVKHGPDSQP
jgi:hypothetical protein